ETVKKGGGNCREPNDPEMPDFPFHNESELRISTPAAREAARYNYVRPTQQGKGKTMRERELGKGGLRVSAVGLGCMGMSEFYDPSQINDEESIRVIQRYLDAGGNFLDTADMYGVGRNEALVGKAIRGRRDRVVLATKFGN